MKQSQSLVLFNQNTVRRHWDADKELWHFSVVDVVRALTDQPSFQTARKYWNKLKERLKKEGSQSVINCHQLKMRAADGKFYFTRGTGDSHPAGDRQNDEKQEIESFEGL